MSSNYDILIEKIFFDRYKNNLNSFTFLRTDPEDTCEKLNINKPKNLGDVVYSYRFRKKLPNSISRTLSNGDEWIIVGAGIGEYEFRIASPSKLTPDKNIKPIKILDATPEILKRFAPSTDEQALLTKVRYNRLVDIFLGITCYSIQNHFRTTVSDIGQIEVDEIYICVDKKGKLFSIPCQAKSSGDSFGIVQAMQDKSLCQEKYKNTECLPLVMQFINENLIAMAIVDVETDKSGKSTFMKVDEKHYQLIQNS